MAINFHDARSCVGLNDYCPDWSHLLFQDFPNRHNFPGDEKLTRLTLQSLIFIILDVFKETSGYIETF